VRRRKENGHQRGRGFNGEGRGTGEPWAPAHGCEEERKWKNPPLWYVAGDDKK
jgi:hypothetical protein